MVSASLYDLTVIEIYWLKGKSYWVLYALRRRLAEGKPVIWYRDSRRYLFVEEGAFEVPERFRSTTFQTHIWTLVDADESLSGIPSYLAVHDTKHLNIFVSYPQSSRWKPLQSTTQCAVVIMNPWTRTEISQALAHLLLPSIFELTILFCAALSFMDLQPATRV